VSQCFHCVPEVAWNSCLHDSVVVSIIFVCFLSWSLDSVLPSIYFMSISLWICHMKWTPYPCQQTTVQLTKVNVPCQNGWNRLKCCSYWWFVTISNRVNLDDLSTFIVGRIYKVTCSSSSIIIPWCHHALLHGLEQQLACPPEDRSSYLNFGLFRVSNCYILTLASPCIATKFMGGALGNPHLGPCDLQNSNVL